MARPKPDPDSEDAPLRRLGGGRWQTRDGRFTIEPQSGTWVVVDDEQADDLGLPLVRGPFRSLTDAKTAIGTARTSAPAASPLAGRLADREDRRDDPPSARADPGATHEGEPRDEPAAARRGRTTERVSGGPAGPRDGRDNERAEPEAAGVETRRERSRRVGLARQLPGGAEAAEPAWLTDLESAQRGRARRLIARLQEAGVSDAAALVRRDILGDVPAVAAIAIGRRLADLPDDAEPAAVVELLTDGRDERLDVRWRLVDGAGRPIVIETNRLRRR